MLTPEFLTGCADRMTEIASGLENYIVNEIIRRLSARLSRGDELQFTAYDKWQMQVLQEAGVMYRDVLKQIAKYTGYGYDEIKRAMEEAAIESLHYDDVLYQNAGISLDVLYPGIALSDDEISKKATRLLFERSPYYVRLMERAYNATNGAWKNLTRTEAYSLQQNFVSAMDRAYNRTVSGAVSYTKAIFR